MPAQLPSKYQQAFYDELTNTTNSIMINAMAGSGKTTSIVEATKLIPPGEPTIFLAFNKSIAETLKTRVPQWVTASTLHSFGARALMLHYGALKIDENKVYGLALKMYTDICANPNKEEKNSYCYRVATLVGKMQMTLADVEDVEGLLMLALRFGIEIYDNEIEAAKVILEASVKLSKTVIDFNDMIYIPAITNLKMKKFKYVFVDEVQDLNAAQQTLVKKIIHPKGGRLICVGDPKQSIYGFAGSDLDSYNNMRNLMPNTVELPLSICYRCTQEIVKFVQTIVPGIEFNPAAPVGVPPRDGSYNEIKAGNWVLCRNTQPLVLLWLKLVREERKAYIKGREIGKNLINLIKRTKTGSIENMLKKLNADRVELKIKLIKKRVYRPDQSDKMIEFNEKFQVIKILSKGMVTVNELVTKIDSIFMDKGTDAVVLSTIHKAKGSETDNVFILCKELIPSKYAKSEEDLMQEENLRYVAYTRAKKDLVFINDFDLEEEKKNMADMA